MNKDSGSETPPTSEVVERHYWKAVTFLVILILVGSGFWGVRRFAPAVFLGKPDLIAVPNEERLPNPNHRDVSIQEARTS